MLELINETYFIILYLLQFQTLYNIFEFSTYISELFQSLFIYLFFKPFRKSLLYFINLSVE